MGYKFKSLDYVDDTITFASSNEYSLGRTMIVLQEYEHQSSQKVNKNKGFFYLHQNVTTGIPILVEKCVGMIKGSFPIKYLGVLSVIQEKWKEHYAELIERVKGKLQAWKWRMLSFCAKEVLLSSGLQSIPIYIICYHSSYMCDQGIT